MAKIVIERIMALLFGTKYYLNIINWKGTDRCQPTEFIWKTREQAEAHRKKIEDTLSFRFIQTISFRSRIEY